MVDTKTCFSTKIVQFPCLSDRKSTRLSQAEMDELVADLSSALVRTNDPPSAHSDTTIGTRESPSGTPIRKTSRKRRGKKRRSDYPPSREIRNISAESNDSVEEALMDYIENIKCQSDSDPEDEMSFTKRLLKVQLHGRDNLDPYPVPEREKGESDSVSEPLVGLTKRRKKRKRKHKRVSSSQSLNDRDSSLAMVNLKALSRTRKRKVCGKSAIGSEIHNSLRRRDEEGSLADIENGLSSGCGEPMETNTSSNHFYKLPSRLHRASTSKTYSMPKERNAPLSSSWLRCEDREEKMSIDLLRADLSSSGESDLEGLFTNDEGCMGDDEKEESSFECDVKISPWWDEKTASDVEEEKFQNIVNGVMDGYRRPFISGIEGKDSSGSIHVVLVFVKVSIKGHLTVILALVTYALISGHRRGDPRGTPGHFHNNPPKNTMSAEKLPLSPPPGDTLVASSKLLKIGIERITDILVKGTFALLAKDG